MPHDPNGGQLARERARTLQRALYPDFEQPDTRPLANEQPHIDSDRLFAAIDAAVDGGDRGAVVYVGADGTVSMPQRTLVLTEEAGTPTMPESTTPAIHEVEPTSVVSDEPYSALLITIGVSLIDVPPGTPEPEADMLASVRMLGILQPIAVRRHGRRYEVVVGARRVLAARRAAMTIIPALVFAANVPAVTIAAMTLTENNIRRANPLRELDAIQELLSAGATVDSIATELHIDRTLVQARIRLARLIPALRVAVIDGRLQPAVADLAARLDSEGQALVLERLVQRESVPDIRQRRITASEVRRIRDRNAQEAAAAVAQTGDLLIPDENTPRTLPTEEPMWTDATHLHWSGIRFVMQDDASRTEDALRDMVSRAENTSVQWMNDANEYQRAENDNVIRWRGQRFVNENMLAMGPSFLNSGVRVVSERADHTAEAIEFRGQTYRLNPVFVGDAPRIIDVHHLVHRGTEYVAQSYVRVETEQALANVRSSLMATAQTIGATVRNDDGSITFDGAQYVAARGVPTVQQDGAILYDSQRYIAESQVPAAEQDEESWECALWLCERLLAAIPVEPHSNSEGAYQGVEAMLTRIRGLLRAEVRHVYVNGDMATGSYSLSETTSAAYSVRAAADAIVAGANERREEHIRHLPRFGQEGERYFERYLDNASPQRTRRRYIPEAEWNRLRLHNTTVGDF